MTRINSKSFQGQFNCLRELICSISNRYTSSNTTIILNDVCIYTFSCRRCKLSTFCKSVFVYICSSIFRICSTHGTICTESIYFYRTFNNIFQSCFFTFLYGDNLWHNNFILLRSNFLTFSRSSSNNIQVDHCIVSCKFTCFSFPETFN